MANPASFFHHRKRTTALDKYEPRHSYIVGALHISVHKLSCSSEISFSNLKRINTYLRSTCGNERLTSLTLMHIHMEAPVCSQEMVDKFTRLHPRRLKLMNMD